MSTYLVWLIVFSTGPYATVMGNQNNPLTFATSNDCRQGIVAIRSTIKDKKDAKMECKQFRLASPPKPK